MKILTLLLLSASLIRAQCAGCVSVGGGGGGATYSTQLLDLKPTRASATSISIAACSPGPCYVGQGTNNLYAVTGGQVVTSDNVGSSNGTAWGYVKADGLVHVGTNAPGVTCTGCTLDGVVTGPPSGSYPLFIATISGGQFAAFTAANDTRTFLRIDPGTAVPQVFPHWFGYVNSGSGAVFAGDFSHTCVITPVNGVNNGVGINMPSTGCGIIIHHILSSAWDGSAVSMIIKWVQDNGVPGSVNVRFDVDVACPTTGSSETLSFGTPGSTTISVPAFQVFAYSTLAVPTTDGTHPCAPGNEMTIRVKNAASGSGSTYTNGFNVYGLTVVATQ